jgi:hypothetical protein
MQVRDDPYNRGSPEPGLLDCHTAPHESRMLSERASNHSGKHSLWGGLSSESTGTLSHVISVSSHAQRANDVPSTVLGNPASLKRVVQPVLPEVHLLPSEEPFSSYEVASLHTSLGEGPGPHRESSTEEMLSVSSGVDAAASGPSSMHILFQNVQARASYRGKKWYPVLMSSAVDSCAAWLLLRVRFDAIKHGWLQALLATNVQESLEFKLYWLGGG